MFLMFALDEKISMRTLWYIQTEWYFDSDFCCFLVRFSQSVAILHAFNHWSFLFAPIGTISLRFKLLFLHKVSQNANFVVSVLAKIEAVFAAEAQLKQVIVKGLLRDVHFLSGIFERVPHQISVPQKSVVKLAPQGNLLDNFLNSPLFCSLAISSPLSFLKNLTNYIKSGQNFTISESQKRT